MVDHEQFYEQLKAYLELKLQKPFNKTKVALLIANGVKFAAKAQGFSEEQVKDLVLRAVHDVVSASDKIDATDKEQILILVDLIGSDIIDKLIDFARDGVTFLKTNVFKCCKKEKKHISSYNRATAGSLGHTDTEFTKLKEYLDLRLQRPFDAGKVIGIIAAGIKFIEEFNDLSGVEKKNLVIHALREVISSTTRLEEVDKTELLELIDIVADEFIDLLVTFGHNQYKLFKESGCKGCFSC